MYSFSDESDIQLQLYFLDCEPNFIDRTLNDTSIIDQLFRAASNRTIKIDRKKYQREECDRVTDIDQITLLDSPTLFSPKTISRRVPIEIINNDYEEIQTSTPTIGSETYNTQSPPSEAKSFIPPAPPLPKSLDLAIKIQSKIHKTSPLSPDQQSLWSKVRYPVSLTFM